MPTASNLSLRDANLSLANANLALCNANLTSARLSYDEGHAVITRLRIRREVARSILSGFHIAADKAAGYR